MTEARKGNRVYFSAVETVDLSGGILPGTLESAEFPVGTRLIDALDSAGFSPAADCGGVGRCGKCRVEVGTISGPPWKMEKKESVLACQTKIADRMVVFSAKRKISAKSSENGSRKKVAEASPKDGASLGAAVDLGTTTIVVSLVELTTGRTLATGETPNPQRRFGADILSRIAAASSSENKAELKRLAADAVGELLRRLAVENGVTPRSIRRLTVAGNTAMEYLLLGLDPEPLGRFPFDPPQTVFSPVSAESFGWKVAPGAPVYLLPILAGFIGGDLVAGTVTLADRLFVATGGEGKTEKDSVSEFGPIDGPPRLLLDMGTNGEILLFHAGEIFAASTAAGPVFEGAHIRRGMTAGPGAIDRIDWTGAATEEGVSAKEGVSAIGGVAAAGICGSGLVDAVAELLRLGFLAPSGRLAAPFPQTTAKGSLSERLVEIDGQRAFFLTGKPEDALAVPLFQDDIRQVQLAVGAMGAGLEILLRRANLSAGDLDRIYLAGGFGSRINRENAKRIGLLPAAVSSEKIEYCGNTSLSGATAILLEPELLGHAAELCHRTVRVDLTADDFSTRFARAMTFPIDSF